MKLVNLTGHTVTLLGNGDPKEFHPSGTLVRLREKEISHTILEGIKIKTIEYENQDMRSWPSPSPDTLYIVSYMIARSAPERDDLVFPFDLVRKPGGVIIGCRSFAKIYKAESIEVHPDNDESIRPIQQTITD